MNLFNPYQEANKSKALAFFADIGYSTYLFALWKSIIRHNPDAFEKYDWILYTDNITKDLIREKLGELFSEGVIIKQVVKSHWKDVKTTTEWARRTMYKWEFLWEFSYDQILFIESDIGCFGNIDLIFEKDDCSDLFMKAARHQTAGWLPKYFRITPGVVLTGKGMRNPVFVDALMKFCHTKNTSFFGDDPMINKFLDKDKKLLGKVKYLPYEYGFVIEKNFFTEHTRAYPKIKDKIVLCHFSDPKRVDFGDVMKDEWLPGHKA